MANAIYAGSFDPFTNGHLNIADKASQIFDKVYVVVASNPNKPAKFLTIDEREKSINNALKAQKLTNVEALSHDGLLVDLAKKLDVHHFIRGLRPLGDFESEYNMAITNKDISGGDVETVFILADPNQFHISSSLVRELFNMRQDVQRFVPPAIYSAMRELL